MDATLENQFHHLSHNKMMLHNYEKRIRALQQLEEMVLQNQQAFCKAISEDFRHRSYDETTLGEIFPLVDEIKYIKKHLKSWLKPQHKSIAPLYWPAQGYTQLQPLGVVGIIVPWNYPLILSLAPLAAAIAAGNGCMVKISEYTPQFGALLSELVKKYFDNGSIVIINGDAAVAQEFTALPFQHILFTGASSIGKKVMAAASQNLTPVTLELGGKSPVIIDDIFPIEEAVQCILRGKLLNAGQTCVAPDYVWLPLSRRDEFIKACQKTALKLYPTLLNNNDYTCIINDRHWQRLQSLLDDALAKGATFIPLSEDIRQTSQTKFQPGLVLNVKPDMRIMQEEIFGPLLPVDTYTDIQHAIHEVDKKPNPLTLYCFTRDKTLQQKIIKETLSGSLCFNESLLQIVQNNLPFGGVGHSGMGEYRGRHGVETFSKIKPVFCQGRFHPANLLKPPYGRVFKVMMRFLLGSNKT